MSGDFKVIGLNIGGHDGGCALLIGGQIFYAISEERLNRYKYSPGWIASLFYCLQAAQITLDEIDLFVFSVYGQPLSAGYHGGLTHLGVTPDKIVSVDHHLSHALGAFSFSPFDQALVIVMDGLGNNPDRPDWKGIGNTYEAFTNFLGFSDLEAGKTMGLAAYGDPTRFQAPLFSVEGVQVNSELEENHQHGVIRYGRKFGLPFGACYCSILKKFNFIN